MKKFYTAGSIAMLCAMVLVVFAGCNSLKNANKLLGSGKYPRTNANVIYIETDHTITSPNPKIAIQYLAGQLTANGMTVVEAPIIQAQDSGSKLLAALRDTNTLVGTVLLAGSNIPFTDREILALSLFVQTGGDVVLAGRGEGQFADSNRLLDSFGLDCINVGLPEEDKAYFTYPQSVSRGHVFTNIDAELSMGFHPFDKVVLLNPRKLIIKEPKNKGYTYKSTLYDEDGEPYGIKATSKVSILVRDTATGNSYKKQGSFQVISDDYFLFAPILNGNPSELEKSSYQGGLITSGNLKCALNLIRPNKTIPLILDTVGPDLSRVDTGDLSINRPSNLVFCEGDIIDISGVARVSATLNGMPLDTFDAFTMRPDRVKVNRFINANEIISFHEDSLFTTRPNVLVITAVDQLNNSSTKTITFNYTAARPKMFFASKQLQSNNTDNNMGLNLKEFNTYTYANENSYTRQPLTTKQWDKDNICQPYTGGLRLYAFGKIETANAGGGRLKRNLEHSNLRDTLRKYNANAELITVHISELNLDSLIIDGDGTPVVVIGTEENRRYENGGGAMLTIKYNDTVILSAPMSDLQIKLNHNLAQSCADDIITSTSDPIPVGNFMENLRLSLNRNRILRSIGGAILADWVGQSYGIVVKTHIYSSIVFDPDALRQDGETSYVRIPLGVRSINPEAENTEGSFTLELFRR